MRWTLVLLSLQCACAVANTTSRVETRVDRTYDQVVRAPDTTTISGGHWDGTTAVVRIETPVFCSTVQRKDVTTLKYFDTTTERVAPTLILGVLSLAAGGVLGAVSGDFSDQVRHNDKGEEIPSAQALGYATAAVLGVGGIIAVGQGLYTWGRSGTKLHDKQERVGFLVNQSPGERCDTIPYNGTVSVEFSRSTVDTQVIEGDMRLSVMPELCGRPEGARIMLDGDHLGTLDIQDCYYAVKADEALAVVTELADPISSSDILEAVEALKIGQMAISKIKTEAWKAAPQAKLAEAALRLKEGARLVIDSLFIQTLRQLKEGNDQALVTASNLLTISQTIGDAPREDFVRLLSAIAEFPTATPALIETFISAFTVPIQRCIRHAECDALPIAQVDFQTAVKIGAEQYQANLVKRTVALSAAAKALDARASETTVSDLDKAESQLKQLRERTCNLGIPTLEFSSECEAADATIVRASEARAKAESQLHKIRAKRTLKAWRGVFPQCRKVAKGAEALSGLRTCTGECKQALDKLRADYRALESFAPENAEYTPETFEIIRTECKSAQCPSCP